MNKNSRDHCNSLFGGKQSQKVAFHQVFGSQLNLRGQGLIEGRDIVMTENVCIYHSLDIKGARA